MPSLTTRGTLEGRHSMEFPHLFSPITINKMELKNRIIMTAMHMGYTPNGEVTERLIDFYCGRAAGGVGLETALYVANQGILSPQVIHFLITNRAECPDTLTCLLNRGDKEVTVVEMTTRIGHDVGTSTRWTLI